MFKKNLKYTIAVLVLIIAIGGYVYYQKNKQVKPVVQPAGIKVSTVNEKEYKAKMNEIFQASETIVKNCLDKNQNLKADIADEENQLLGVTAPFDSLKNLHMTLILALKKMENCPSMPIGDHREVRNSVEALKGEYNWIR